MDKRTKQLILQEASGKLIEENHNGYSYSKTYTDQAISWYLGLLYMRAQRRDPEKFGVFFMRSVREKIQTLLLHWSEERERDQSYDLFHRLLDEYRERGTQNLLMITLEFFEKVWKV